jgi:D-3-phosphoglycerate dehydrogenase
MTPLPHVLLTNPIDADETRRLQSVARVSLAADQRPDTLREAARDADLIIVRAPLPGDVFQAAPRVLAAIRHGAGVDMIPVPAATTAGVLVANVPGANAVTVAEYVIAQMLQLARRLARLDRGVRQAGWLATRPLADSGVELAGKCLGVVGTGAIGAAVARIAGAGLDMRVMGSRRSDAAMPPFMTRAALPDLLAQADYLVLACPLNDDTRGLIGAAQLALMKPGAAIINVSRGPVIDEAALIAALAGGRLSGAALDVFQAQPLPDDSPLRGFEQVLLSPHVAGITIDSMRRMSRGVVDQAIDILAGRPPKHFVNPDAWPGRRTNRFVSPESP